MNFLDHIRRKSIFLRATAFFLAIQFTLFETLVLAQPVHGIGGLGHHPKENPSDVSVPLDSPLPKFWIPEEMGTLEESYAGNSSRLMIYIQDAHDSLEAQENIARLIEYFVKHYGVKTVFEEGYEGPVPTEEYFGFIQDAELKRKISYFLMDQLRLGGAEYAHINRPHPNPLSEGEGRVRGDFELIGADSIKAHLENIAAYEQSSRRREIVAKDLEKIAKELKALSDKTFPKALRHWLKLKEKFEEDRLGIAEYLNHFRFELKPGMSLQDVLAKLSQFEKALEDTYLKTERDRKLLHYQNKIRLLQRLNQMQVSAEEYQAVKAALTDLDTREIAAFIARENKRPLVLSKAWEEGIRTAVRFYEIAEQRDKAIEKAILENPSNKFQISNSKIQNKSGDSEINLDFDIRYLKFQASILVFGGFHKSAIKEILKRNGFSYLVISPRITQTSKRHQGYYKRLMSGGYHPFEIPLLVKKAAAPPRVFEVYSQLHMRTLAKEGERFRHLEPRIFNQKLTQSKMSQFRRSELRNDFVLDADLEEGASRLIPRIQEIFFRELLEAEWEPHSFEFYLRNHDEGLLQYLRDRLDRNRVRVELTEPILNTLRALFIRAYLLRKQSWLVNHGLSDWTMINAYSVLRQREYRDNGGTKKLGDDQIYGILEQELLKSKNSITAFRDPVTAAKVLQDALGFRSELRQEVRRLAVRGALVPRRSELRGHSIPEIGEGIAWTRNWIAKKYQTELEESPVFTEVLSRSWRDALRHLTVDKIQFERLRFMLLERMGTHWIHWSVAASLVSFFYFYYKHFPMGMIGYFLTNYLFLNLGIAVLLFSLTNRYVKESVITLGTAIDSQEAYEKLKKTHQSVAWGGEVTVFKNPIHALLSKIEEWSQNLANNYFQNNSLKDFLHFASAAALVAAVVGTILFFWAQGFMMFTYFLMGAGVFVMAGNFVSFDRVRQGEVVRSFSDEVFKGSAASMVKASFVSTVFSTLAFGFSFSAPYFVLMVLGLYLPVISAARYAGHFFDQHGFSKASEAGEFKQLAQQKNLDAILRELAEIVRLSRKIQDTPTVEEDQKVLIAVLSQLLLKPELQAMAKKALIPRETESSAAQVIKSAVGIRSELRADKTFSFEDLIRQWQWLKGHPGFIFDSLVIGGGAAGAGAIRDAASRGDRSALLVERDVLAGETSSKSSKFIHGGLWYLFLAAVHFKKAIEALYEDDPNQVQKKWKRHLKLAFENLRLVWGGKRETRIHVRTTNGIVKPLPFTALLYEDSPFGKWPSFAGIGFYELFAYLRRAHFGATCFYRNTLKAAEAFPFLNFDKLIAAVTYSDARADNDKLLVVQAIRKAYDADSEAHPIKVFAKVEYVESKWVDATDQEEGHFEVTLRSRFFDEEGDSKNETITVKARTLVNATGAHIDDLREKEAEQPVEKITVLSRGSHIEVTNRFLNENISKIFPGAFALMYKKRRYFILPHHSNGIWYLRIGPTDRRHSDPNQVYPSADEIEELLGAGNSAISEKPEWKDLKVTRDDIYWTDAGLRNMERPEDEAEAKDLENISRAFKIVSTRKGNGLVLHAVGVKLTEMRWAGKVIGDRLQKELRKMGIRKTGKSRTAREAYSPPSADFLYRMDRMDYDPNAAAFLKRRIQYLKDEFMLLHFSEYMFPYGGLRDALVFDKKGKPAVNPEKALFLLEVMKSVRNWTPHQTQREWDQFVREYYENKKAIGQEAGSSLLITSAQAFDRLIRDYLLGNVKIGGEMQRFVTESQRYSILKITNKPLFLQQILELEAENLPTERIRAEAGEEILRQAHLPWHYPGAYLFDYLVNSLHFIGNIIGTVTLRNIDETLYWRMQLKELIRRLYVVLRNAERLSNYSPEKLKERELLRRIALLGSSESSPLRSEIRDKMIGEHFGRNEPEANGGAWINGDRLRLRSAPPRLSAAQQEFPLQIISLLLAEKETKRQRKALKWQFPEQFFPRLGNLRRSRTQYQHPKRTLPRPLPNVQEIPSVASVPRRAEMRGDKGKKPVPEPSAAPSADWDHAERLIHEIKGSFKPVSESAEGLAHFVHFFYNPYLLVEYPFKSAKKSRRMAPEKLETIYSGLREIGQTLQNLPDLKGADAAFQQWAEKVQSQQQASRQKILHNWPIASAILGGKTTPTLWHQLDIFKQRFEEIVPELREVLERLHSLKAAQPEQSSRSEMRKPIFPIGPFRGAISEDSPLWMVFRNVERRLSYFHYRIYLNPLPERFEAAVEFAKAMITDPGAPDAAVKVLEIKDEKSRDELKKPQASKIILYVETPGDLIRLIKLFQENESYSNFKSGETLQGTLALDEILMIVSGSRREMLAGERNGINHPIRLEKILTEAGIKTSSQNREASRFERFSRSGLREQAVAPDALMVIENKTEKEILKDAAVQLAQVIHQGDSRTVISMPGSGYWAGILIHRVWNVLYPGEKLSVIPFGELSKEVKTPPSSPVIILDDFIRSGEAMDESIRELINRWGIPQSRVVPAALLVAEHFKPASVSWGAQLLYGVQTDWITIPNWHNLRERGKLRGDLESVDAFLQSKLPQEFDRWISEIESIRSEMRSKQTEEEWVFEGVSEWMKTSWGKKRIKTWERPFSAEEISNAIVRALIKVRDIYPESFIDLRNNKQNVRNRFLSVFLPNHNPIIMADEDFPEVLEELKSRNLPFGAYEQRMGSRHIYKDYLYDLSQVLGTASSNPIRKKIGEIIEDLIFRYSQIASVPVIWELFIVLENELRNNQPLLTEMVKRIGQEVQTNRYKDPYDPDARGWETTFYYAYLRNWWLKQIGETHGPLPRDYKTLRDEARFTVPLMLLQGLNGANYFKLKPNVSIDRMRNRVDRIFKNVVKLHAKDPRRGVTAQEFIVYEAVRKVIGDFHQKIEKRVRKLIKSYAVIIEESFENPDRVKKYFGFGEKLDGKELFNLWAFADSILNFREVFNLTKVSRAELRLSPFGSDVVPKGTVRNTVRTVRPFDRRSELRMTLINPKIRYSWGSGYFRDIADIRRRVYTTYYTLTEHADLMQRILGRLPADHVKQLLSEIENPTFFIDSKNYEQIKAYLWERAKETFPAEIEAWERGKDEIVTSQSSRVLDEMGAGLSGWLTAQEPKGAWRRAVLTAAAMELFPVLEQKNPRESAGEIQKMLAAEDQPEGINVPIDFSDRLYADVVRKPGSISVLAGTVNTLAMDLKLYGENLLESWLRRIKEETGISEETELAEEALQRGIRITFIANERLAPRNNNLVLQFNVTRKNLEDLLELPAFAALKRWKKLGLFRVISFTSNFPGTVLTDIGGEVSEGLLSSASVIALGEQNNVTLDGLQVDSYRIAPIRDFAHIFYTGIKYDTDNFKYPHFSVLCVPAGVLAAIDYAPDFESRLQAKQFYALYRFLPQPLWETLIAKTRETENGNILDVAQNSGRLNEEQMRNLQNIREPSLEDRLASARKLVGPFGGRYERLEIPEDRFRKRVIHILQFPQGVLNRRGERLDLGVQLAQAARDYLGKAKTKITFLDLLNLQPAALFGFNFLYFITRNLVLYFNKSNPHFRLAPKFFGEGIDVLKTEINGETVLYPPLYRKGAVGKRKDGTFVFGRIEIPRTGTVSLPVGRDMKTLSWTQVNPLRLNDDDPVTLFTPFEDAYRNAAKQAPHTFGETRSMFFTPTNDRYNFVMINDKLLGVVRGVTEIPPFGTVLSVPKDYFTAEEKEMLEAEVSALKQGRKEVNVFQNVKFSFDLGPKWQDTEWVMGGALLMVDEGRVENLRYEPAMSRDSVYHLEGWNLESSQRTQETPVETELREARSTIGLTESGQFFIAIIEGRANNRTGATHQETVDWLQEYFKGQGTKLYYALDLDSASSVALGFIKDGSFNLLSQTARGSDSKLWDIRYLNHIAFLKPLAPNRQLAGDLASSPSVSYRSEVRVNPSSEVSAMVSKTNSGLGYVIAQGIDRAMARKVLEAEPRLKFPPSDGDISKWSERWKRYADGQKELAKKLLGLFLARNFYAANETPFRELTKQINEVYIPARLEEYKRLNLPPPQIEALDDITAPAYWITPSSPKPSGKYPLAIFLHGGMGTKEFPWFDLLEQKLIEKNTAVLRLDIPGHGKNLTTIRAPEDLDRALVRILKALESNPAIRNRIDLDRLYLIGFSMGGYLTVRAAKQPFLRDRFRLLVAINPPLRPYFLDRKKYAPIQKYLGPMFAAADGASSEQMESLALGEEPFDAANLVVKTGNMDKLVDVDFAWLREKARGADMSQFAKGSHYPAGRIKDKLFDEIVSRILPLNDALRSEMRDDARKEIYGEASRRLVEDAFAKWRSGKKELSNAKKIQELSKNVGYLLGRQLEKGELVETDLPEVFDGLYRDWLRYATQSRSPYTGGVEPAIIQRASAGVQEFFLTEGFPFSDFSDHVFFHDSLDLGSHCSVLTNDLFVGSPNLISIEGSHKTLAHEAIHHQAGGFPIHWLDEGITEYLTVKAMRVKGGYSSGSLLKGAAYSTSADHLKRWITPRQLQQFPVEGDVTLTLHAETIEARPWPGEPDQPLSQAYPETALVEWLIENVLPNRAVSVHDFIGAYLRGDVPFLIQTFGKETVLLFEDLDHRYVQNQKDPGFDLAERTSFLLSEGRKIFSAARSEMRIGLKNEWLAMGDRSATTGKPFWEVEGRFSDANASRGGESTNQEDLALQLWPVEWLTLYRDQQDHPFLRPPFSFLTVNQERQDKRGGRNNTANDHEVQPLNAEDKAGKIYRHNRKHGPSNILSLFPSELKHMRKDTIKIINIQEKYTINEKFKGIPLGSLVGMPRSEVRDQRPETSQRVQPELPELAAAAREHLVILEIGMYRPTHRPGSGVSANVTLAAELYHSLGIRTGVIATDLPEAPQEDFPFFQHIIYLNPTPFFDDHPGLSRAIRFEEMSGTQFHSYQQRVEEELSKVVSKIAAENPDKKIILNIHDGGAIALAAMKAADSINRKHPGKIFWGVAGHNMDLLHYDSFPPYVRNAFQQAAELSDYYVAITPDQVAKTQQLYSLTHPEKMAVIPHGVDTHFFDPDYIPETSVLPKAIRDRKIDRKNSNILLYWGRVVPGKGVIKALDGFAAYMKAGPEREQTYFIIAGSEGKTNYEAAVRERIQKMPPEIQKYVIRLTDAALQNLPRVLDFSDVSILLSGSEVLSRAALESWAMARPVIASDIPGLRASFEAPHNGSNGNISDLGFLVADYRSPDAVADAIRKTFQRANQNRWDPQKIRGHILHNFSTDALLKSTLELYLKTAGIPQPSVRSELRDKRKTFEFLLSLAILVPPGFVTTLAAKETAPLPPTVRIDGQRFLKESEILFLLEELRSGDAAVRLRAALTLKELSAQRSFADKGIRREMVRTLGEVLKISNDRDMRLVLTVTLSNLREDSNDRSGLIEMATPEVLPALKKLLEESRIPEERSDAVAIIAGIFRKFTLQNRKEVKNYLDLFTAILEDSSKKEALDTRVEAARALGSMPQFGAEKIRSTFEKLLENENLEEKIKSAVREALNALGKSGLARSELRTEEFYRILGKYRTEFESYYRFNPKVITAREVNQLLLADVDYISIRRRYGSIDAGFKIVDEALTELVQALGLEGEWIRLLDDQRDRFSERVKEKATALLKIHSIVRNPQADGYEFAMPYRILMGDIIEFNSVLLSIAATFGAKAVDAVDMISITTDSNTMRYDTAFALLRNLPPKPLKDIRVLDIGFGTGILLYFLKFFGLDAQGISLSKNGQKIAAKQGLKVYLKNLFALGLPDADLGDKPFDIVLLSSVLDVLENDQGKRVQDAKMFQEVLRKASSMLAAGGKMIAYQPDPYPWKEGDLNKEGFQIIEGRANLKPGGILVLSRSELRDNKLQPTFASRRVTRRNKSKSVLDKESLREHTSDSMDDRRFFTSPISLRNKRSSLDTVPNLSTRSRINVATSSAVYSFRLPVNADSFLGKVSGTLAPIPPNDNGRIQQNRPLKLNANRPAVKGALSMSVEELGRLSAAQLEELVVAVYNRSEVRLILHSDSLNVGSEAARRRDQIAKLPNVVVTSDRLEIALDRWGFERGIAVEITKQPTSAVLKVGPRKMRLEYMAVGEELGNILAARLVATSPDGIIPGVHRANGLIQVSPALLETLQQYLNQQVVEWAA